MAANLYAVVPPSFDVVQMLVMAGFSPYGRTPAVQLQAGLFDKLWVLCLLGNSTTGMKECLMISHRPQSRRNRSRTSSIVFLTTQVYEKHSERVVSCTSGGRTLLWHGTFKGGPRKLLQQFRSFFLGWELQDQSKSFEICPTN